MYQDHYVTSYFHIQWVDPVSHITFCLSADSFCSIFFISLVVSVFSGEHADQSVQFVLMKPNHFRSFSASSSCGEAFTIHGVRAARSRMGVPFVSGVLSAPQHLFRFTPGSDARHAAGFKTDSRHYSVQLIATYCILLHCTALLPPLPTR